MDRGHERSVRLYVCLSVYLAGWLAGWPEYKVTRGGRAGHYRMHIVIAIAIVPIAVRCGAGFELAQQLSTLSTENEREENREKAREVSEGETEWKATLSTSYTRRPDCNNHLL
ncbi:hypothetical protein BKA81DRAFT_368101 [Phyllosticta paracitricarpa]